MLRQGKTYPLRHEKNAGARRVGLGMTHGPGEADSANGYPIGMPMRAISVTQSSKLRPVSPDPVVQETN